MSSDFTAEAQRRGGSDGVNVEFLNPNVQSSSNVE